jgi:uncharacterized protein (DUF1697 family)
MLRAVNVGGRTVAMTDLRAIYEELGHHDVVTYVQSGNVVSRTNARSAAAVQRAVRGAIAQDLGLDVEVVVRTPRELRAILDGNPYLRVRPRPDPKTLHVTFLATKPDAALVRALDEQAFAPDEFRVVGRDVYVSCPGGYGRTKINNTWFERRLQVAATTRNWNTVNKLAEMAIA